ncbi:MAG: DUF424 family protein [Nanoarchaeota archaeon]
MILKKHLSGGKLVIAVCDSKLLGKKIEEGNFVLDLVSNFYKGEETTPEKLLKELNSSFMINAVGEKSVAVLLDNKIITKKDLKTISGVPYCLVVFD